MTAGDQGNLLYFNTLLGRTDRGEKGIFFYYHGIFFSAPLWYSFYFHTFAAHNLYTMDAIAFVQDQMNPKKPFPNFRAGDNVTVNYRIVEGNKERIQSFKGDVIKRQGHGQTATFTVRKISDGIGVERLFPLYSPNIESIAVNKVGKVRRARLYYLRERSGKSARIKEKRV